MRHDALRAFGGCEGSATVTLNVFQGGAAQMQGGPAEGGITILEVKTLWNQN